MSEEEKNAATKPQRAGPLAAEALKAEEAKAPPKYRRRKVVEKKIEAASAKEGESDQVGSLPGLQEGERCCKSNNRSWRFSTTRHPGSRYCIYHIR